jgi:Holliday junction resolvase RusA-like endonuclease
MNVVMRLNYRVAHDIHKAYDKALSGRLLEARLSHDAIQDPLTLVFTYTSPDKRKKDLSNMLAYTDKHLSDLLVKQGIILDDSTAYINRVIYLYTGIKPKIANPINLYIYKD